MQVSQDEEVVLQVELERMMYMILAEWIVLFLCFGYVGVCLNLTFFEV